MGEDARASSRREGERMVADEVRFLGETAAELLASYDADVDRPGFPTFASVERFWSSEVEPRLMEFASMQADFGRGTEMPAGSRWRENSEIPAPGEWRAGG